MTRPATDEQLTFWEERIQGELAKFRASEPFNRWRPPVSELRDDEQVGIILMLIARIREAERWPKMSKWLDIITAPKTGGRMMLGNETGPKILLYGKDEGYVVGFWNGFAWDDGDFNSSMSGFTHWQPLTTP